MNSEKNQEQNLKTFSTKKQLLEEKVKKLSAEVRRLERHEVRFVSYFKYRPTNCERVYFFLKVNVFT